SLRGGNPADPGGDRAEGGDRLAVDARSRRPLRARDRAARSGAGGVAGGQWRAHVRTRSRAGRHRLFHAPGAPSPRRGARARPPGRRDPRRASLRAALDAAPWRYRHGAGELCLLQYAGGGGCVDRGAGEGAEDVELMDGASSTPQADTKLPKEELDRITD